MSRPPITLKDLQKTACWPLNGHLTDLPKVKGKSKMGNKIVYFNSEKFDSQGELNRYLELRMLERAGEIKNLIHHPPSYELNEGGNYSLRYEPDFTYTDKSGEFIVEDFKGHLTAVYKKKRALMLKVHGITIKETRKK